ncbi:porin [Verrucomicrobiales bacterium BCK34]|nr:porin [Verrucomicrobiales bacterium BCK34]
MKNYNRMTKLFTTASAAAVLAGGSLVAGDYGKAVIDDKMPIEADPWTICNVFDHTTLYEGDGFIEKVKIIGRYQGQFHDVSDNLNSSSRRWDHRRWRAGVQVDMANDLKFKSTFNLDTSPNFDANRFVRTVEEMVIEWEPSEDFYVIIGKQKPAITREYATSSKKILTFERSQIVNEVVADKSWGVAVGFAAAGLNHEVGVFANTYDNDWATTNFNGGAMLTYRTSAQITEATEIFFDYQYNDVNDMNAAVGNAAGSGSAYEHVLALGTESEFGAFGLVTDIIYAADKNGNGPDTHGFVVMPSYDITDKLQFVAKYAYMDRGALQRPQSRVGGEANDFTDLHTFYAGFNYRICGDQLKLMAGYEYATGEDGTGADYNSDSWLVGVRTYW